MIIPGLPFLNPQSPDDDNEENWDTAERVFPNGRRIEDNSLREVVIDAPGGTRRLRVKRVATGDCGCQAKSADLYLCSNTACERIVCHRHAAGPCQECKGEAFCSRCILSVKEHEEDPVATLLCLKCFDEKTLSIFGRLIRLLSR